MSQNNHWSPLKFKAVFFFCCVNSIGYTLCYEYCVRALHDTIIWDPLFFSWLCTAQHNLIGDRIAIGWFIFISFKVCTNSRNKFLSIIFLYPLFTGTVRRFLEKFADIERVVFAVENADEVMINRVIGFQSSNNY